MEKAAYEQTRAMLTEMGLKLDEMLQHKDRLSKLSLDMEAVRLEQQHFLQYYDETSDKDIDLHSTRKMSAARLLKLWAQSEECGKEHKQVSGWRKLLNFF